MMCMHNYDAQQHRAGQIMDRAHESPVPPRGRSEVTLLRSGRLVSLS